VRRPGIRPKKVGIVTVPDISASELLAQVTQAVGLDDIAFAFRDWDFFTDREGHDLGYAGKTYEVVVWKKGGSGSMKGDELRELFEERKYTGIVPAFLVWLMEHQPFDTFYATLPEEAAKCHYTYQGRHYVASPYHYRDRNRSRLYAITTPHKCSAGEHYLAFREIPSAG